MNLRALFGLPELRNDESLSARLKSAENRIEALELGNAERQMHVLNVAEKVMKQLEARERMRGRETPAAIEESPVSDAGGDDRAIPIASPRRRHIRAW